MLRPFLSSSKVSLSSEKNATSDIQSGRAMQDLFIAILVQDVLGQEAEKQLNESWVIAFKGVHWP